jgi:hypothetical protein
VSYMSSGSRFRVEAVAPNNELDVLHAALRPDFLEAAGWKADEQILAPPNVGGDEGESARTPQECLTAVCRPPERAHSSLEEPNVGRQYSTAHTLFCPGRARFA